MMGHYGLNLDGTKAVLSLGEIKKEYIEMLKSISNSEININYADFKSYKSQEVKTINQAVGSILEMRKNQW